MNPQKDTPIRILRRQTLSENWFRLEKVTFEQTAGNGSTETLEREVYHNGPGAAVLPIDPQRGTVLLVRQLRIPACLNGDDPMLVEACAGMVDEGDAPGDTVRKEAEQELGYRLHRIRKVAEVYTSPGASAEKLTLFLAEYGAGDRISAGGGLPDEGERIEILELPLRRAWDMVDAGQIVDAKTLLLLQHARLAEQRGKAATTA
jgi:nudix-type nucleoside diphosphatase (YffH/AdpP family)